MLDSLLSLLIPFAAKTTDLIGFVIIRTLQGLAEGFAFPSIYTLLAHWTPTKEKNQMVAIVYSGIPFGTVLANALPALIIVKFGWPFVFYFSGLSGLIWYILWAGLVRSSPSKDPLISDKERQYIMSNLMLQNSKEILETPWKKILLSGPVWAISFTTLLYDWGYFTFVTQLPSYLKGQI